MAVGLIGFKRGMTRVFTEDGDAIPVTVVEVMPNGITQVKTVDTDGYNAIQVSIGKRRANRVSKPVSGHFAQAKVEPGLRVTEFRVDNPQEFECGNAITVEHFQVGDKIKVTGTSKGKGFAGSVKRNNFRTQDATHGNSLSHRAPGSTGQNQTPGRVFKGKKMPGQLGNVRRTQTNLEVVDVKSDINVILIKGSIPGAPGGSVLIHPMHGVKKAEKA